VELLGCGHNAANDLYERVEGQVAFRKPQADEINGIRAKPICEFVIHPNQTEEELTRAADILIQAFSEMRTERSEIASLKEIMLAVLDTDAPEEENRLFRRTSLTQVCDMNDSHPPAPRPTRAMIGEEDAKLLVAACADVNWDGLGVRSD